MIISKVRIIVAVAICLLTLNNIRLVKKTKDLDKQVGIAMNNAQAWQDIANQNKNEARLLELNIEDFKNSNDSLIKIARDQQKKLNIKDKQLRQVASTETVIRDTTVQIIPSEERDFCIELKPNQLTTIKVARKDSVVTHTMEILNHQDLFIYEDKVYRRHYKNWFQRLIRFDFKKDKINKYQIVNSNNLIQVLDTRVIHISE